MNRRISVLLVSLGLVLLIFTGCEVSDDPRAVGDLKITNVKMVETSNTALTAPVTFDVTISWNTDSITGDEKASEGIEGLKVYVGNSAETDDIVELKLTDTSYTFKGLLPGKLSSLRVEAVYPDGAYEDPDWTDYISYISFTGGPWYKNGYVADVSGDNGFGVGSFNHLDSMPSSWSSAGDVYYFNSYNNRYQFTEPGQVKWLTVKVNEVTGTNDTATQRNNVQWLNPNFQMVDRDLSGLTNYEYLASVDVAIVDIFGDELLTMKGSETEKTMSSTNFSKLLKSVDSGYYEEKEGYYYVKATCKSMPPTPPVVEEGEEDEMEEETLYGLWGFANNGRRRY